MIITIAEKKIFVVKILKISFEYSKRYACSQNKENNVVTLFNYLNFLDEVNAIIDFHILSIVSIL